MSYKSGNPALNKDTFRGFEPSPKHMTLDGVTNKSFFLLSICLASGFLGWRYASTVTSDVWVPVLLVTALVALVIGVCTSFFKHIAPYTSPVYALLEGFVIGIVSQFYDDMFEGVVIQAVLLTASIFIAMLLLYRFRIIRATENFKLGVAAATSGIVLYYMVHILIGFSGRELPFVESTSIYGIIFTLLVICIAALNLVVDFDFIESGAEQKAPKYMEWYASFGLMVTVIWLYLEILRLLGKLRSR